MTHHPHVHGIVPGGGLSPDGQHWVACRAGFFLPVRVLSRLFRRLFLGKLSDAHQAGTLQFFGDHRELAESKTFSDWLKPLQHCEWVVYAKRPFAGPEAVLAYLSRYTHRVAIANSRLIALDEQGVTFKWKDYRAREQDRHKTLTLSPGEFMRRFLLHVLPAGLHRIRHYGLLANATRQHNLTRARELLMSNNTDQSTDSETNGTDAADGSNETVTYVCPDCGAAMIIIETFERRQLPRAPPVRIDTS
jgi:predicted RNA-binding Zn-ribbon protein involved in translation (DUF1610 family)